MPHGGFPSVVLFVVAMSHRVHEAQGARHQGINASASLGAREHVVANQRPGEGRSEGRWKEKGA